MFKRPWYDQVCWIYQCHAPTHSNHLKLYFQCRPGLKIKKKKKTIHKKLMLINHLQFTLNLTFADECLDKYFNKAKCMFCGGNSIFLKALIWTDQLLWYLIFGVCSNEEPDRKFWTWMSRKSSLWGDLSHQKWLIAATRLECTSLMKDFR